jgi:hypothetical protein
MNYHFNQLIQHIFYYLSTPLQSQLITFVYQTLVSSDPATEAHFKYTVLYHATIYLDKTAEPFNVAVEATTSIDSFNIAQYAQELVGIVYSDQQDSKLRDIAIFSLVNIINKVSHSCLPWIKNYS